MKHVKHYLGNTLSGIGVAIPEGTNVGAGATVAGNAILEPWIRCRQLVFIALGAAVAGNVTFTVEARRRDNQAWEPVTDGERNAISITGARYAAGGQLENGALLLTLLTERLGMGTPSADFHGTYDAVRLVASSAGGAAPLGVSYLEFDTDIEPSERAAAEVADDMLDQFLIPYTKPTP